MNIESIRPKEIIIPNDRKEIILFDQDDVLALFNNYLLDIINEKEGTNYTVEDITDYDIIKLLHLKHNIEYYLEQDEDFFYNLKPKDNNLEVFKRLYESNKYEMFIVTYVNMEYPKFLVDKLRWIKKYLPFFPIDRVIPTKHKNAVIGDFLIDDMPRNINEFKYGQAVIYDMPYNRHLEGERIYNLEDFEKRFLKNN